MSPDYAKLFVQKLLNKAKRNPEITKEKIKTSRVAVYFDRTKLKENLFSWYGWIYFADKSPIVEISEDVDPKFISVIDAVAFNTDVQDIYLQEKENYEEN